MSSLPMTFTIGGDLTVNRMGFGAMRITGKGIWGPPENKAEAIKVLQKAVELGVDFIDTADSYGPHVSEELIAEALFPYQKGLVIATKGGFMRSGPDQWTVNTHPDHLRTALNGSLDRLKLDTIDLYQLHRIDESTFEQTMEFLQNAQENGLIKHIGLSEVSVEQIKKAQKYIKVVSVQNKYSVDYRRWESVLNYTKDHHMAFIPWYPMNAGNVAAMNELKKVAEDTNSTPQKVALSWLFHRSDNILLIPGTSKVKHLEENMETIKLHLSADQLRGLDEVGKETIA